LKTQYSSPTPINVNTLTNTACILS